MFGFTNTISFTSLYVYKSEYIFVIYELVSVLLRVWFSKFSYPNAKNA